MKRTTMTIAALVVASIASSSIAPVLAQDKPSGEHPQSLQVRGPHGEGFFMRRDGQRDNFRMRMRGAGAILALVCSDQGRDRLEHMLLSIEQRTDPTGDQQALYDTFKATALDAQADFAAACTNARPDPEAADTDLVDRLKAGIDLQQAHLDAMNAVLPAFEAYYDSLSDEQKQGLQPRRRADWRFDHRRPAPGLEAPGTAAPQQG